MKEFFRKILSSEDSTSSKRLVTLIISLHFIIASFVVLFFAFNVVLKMPKGRIEPDLIELLKQVLEYDFYIIIAGLGFITVDNAGKMLIERAKAKFSKTEDIDTQINIDDIVDKTQNK